MKQLIKKMKQISILLLVLSFVGCNNDDDSNYPQIVAGFTYTINLETGTVTFINISESSNSYEWDFGDGNDSKEINPINTYPSGGTYTVVLKSKNVAGAIDVFESTITFTIPESIALPITFDNANVAYNAATFNGAVFSIVDNPAPGGTNNVASKVGAITNSGTTYEGINFDLGSPIDFATDKTISVNFWADAATTVLMKLEEGNGADTEVTASHTGSGWETLLFNFNPSNQYSRLTLFVDGPGTAAGTFYIDDIMQTETPPSPCTVETAESNSAADLNMTFMSDITTSIIADGASFEWATNPNFDNALNTSCKVAKITKLGSNPWDNTQIDLDAKLDFNANAGLKMKVYSAVAGFKVRLKLEEIGVPTNNTELEVVTTKTNAWEEIEFPFASTNSNKFDKIVIFFDLNAENTDTYYFDDFTLYGTGSGTGGGCVAETTETNSAANLNMTFMSDLTSNIFNDNATFVWADNPNSDNTVNTSCKVAQVTKSGVNPWDNIQIDLDNKLDFSANAGLKIKVYSAQPGFTVLLKLESIANGTNTEIDLTTTKTNEWEELTFAFGADQTDKYDKIVIIFDLTKAANTNTYFFDDLKLYERTNTGGGGTGGGGNTGDYNLSLPIDFESTGFGANWSWNVFENASNPPLEYVANPNASGINTSTTVAKITALQGGQPWVGVETVHGEMGITWDLSASNAIIKIMVYKTVISDVGIKLVNPAGGAQVEIKVANTKINEWEELTFDFSSRIGNGLDGSTNIDQIVVFPDFNTAGRTSDSVVYFDNITFN